jgi:hypothetical protein
MRVVLFFFRNEFLFDFTLVKIVGCRKQKPRPLTALKFFFSLVKERKMNDRGFHRRFKLPLHPTVC